MPQWTAGPIFSPRPGMITRPVKIITSALVTPDGNITGIYDRSPCRIREYVPLESTCPFGEDSLAVSAGEKQVILPVRTGTSAR